MQHFCLNLKHWSKDLCCYFVVVVLCSSQEKKCDTLHCYIVMIYCSSIKPIRLQEAAQQSTWQRRSFEWH